MIVLCGKTCSGKNYIRDLLIKEGIQPVVTYTTRPKREGEIDGQTYHFLSPAEFEKKANEGFFVESTSYSVANGEKWYYGSHFDKKDDNKVIILNPSGIKALKKVKDLEVDPVIFYIKVPDNILRERVLKRGDNIEEFNRRLKADAIDFQGIEDFSDRTILNDGSFDAQTIVSYIKRTAFPEKRKNIKCTALNAFFKATPTVKKRKNNNEIEL